MALMADETLRTWGENIRLRREALTPEGRPRLSGADEQMTQADLGNLLEPQVNQSTVARWERGDMEPRRQYKVQLATVLITDVRLLFPLTRAGVA